MIILLYIIAIIIGCLQASKRLQNQLLRYQVEEYYHAHELWLKDCQIKLQEHFKHVAEIRAELNNI